MSAKEIKVYNCFIDGNALCITEKNFVNLQESKAYFIELTKEQIDRIKALETDNYEYIIAKIETTIKLLEKLEKEIKKQ